MSIHPDLLEKILNFRDERDWAQFHTPKDLAAGLVEFYVSNNAQTSGMEVTRWFKEYVSKLPIPPASGADKTKLATLAEQCAAATAIDDQDTLAAREAEINQIVYRLFDLTDEEIALIEASLLS
jgi:adenine-specific DNA-methyltransferase